MAERPLHKQLGLSSERGVIKEVNSESPSGISERTLVDTFPLVCLTPLLWGSDQRQQFGSTGANPQYRKTRRAKGLGTPACAQCACMREQEPKVLASETLVELVDLKILLKHNTIPVDLKMSWYSGATARPPGEWLHPGLHP